ncbi:MAG: carboxypeptidase [Gemmatimonadales bacterium]|nr:MAG: carboxypeptidase [Gemmatimonadales bacterium]
MTSPQSLFPRVPHPPLVLCLHVRLQAGAPHQAQDVEVPVDTTWTAEHTVTIGGETVPYTTTAGFQPVWDSNGEAIASVFYTYYERSDVDDRSRRPLVFSFNGGPGSASVWMHIGYTGPRFLSIDDEGFPVQPYGFEENPHSILDVADIVYVDPVNTGFSRPLEGVNPQRFFGVYEDINYLAGWIETFVTRQARWESPKFLKGESYGTNRVAGLANRLQSSHWMYLNGVILVSPTGMGVDAGGPATPALYLPHYAATAWYHDALDPSLQNRDLDEWLHEVEEFVIEEYIPAVARGGFLPEDRRQAIAEQVALYSGTSVDFVLNNNLTLPIGRWRKELLRDRGQTVGRLDARYKGIDRDDGGISYDYDPALTAWNHSFTPAINIYLRDELGIDTDLRYFIFGPTSPWSRSPDNTGENLRSAMAQNPFLNVMIQAGYYDGGTDYFSAKYTMWNMDPSGRLQDRFRFETYRSGHMMYLRQEDLESSNRHIREFLEASIPPAGEPAIYR